MTDLHYMDLLAVSELIRTQALTSVEVTRKMIERSKRLNPQLHAIQLLMTETAREQARKADAEIAAGLWRGRLHGVPIGIKDNVWTAALPTTAGFATRVTHIDPEDATIITRLKDAGAVILSKLALTQGAKFDHDPHQPRPVNPWNAEHWCGVSSSGCGIAVAAGLLYAAVGIDTGGSIRGPSAINGVTGIKPTWGRISRHGIYAAAPSFDTPGTFARTAADAAALLQVIAGSDPKDITALQGDVPDFSQQVGQSLQGMVLGIDWNFVASGGVHEEVVQAVRGAISVFERMGVRTRDVTIPWDFERAVLTMPMIVAELTISMNGNFPEEEPFGGLTGRGGSGIDPFAVVRGYQDRDQLAGALNRVFNDVDFVIAPGLGEVTPTWEEIDHIANDYGRLVGRLSRFGFVFNLANQPTISMPAGFSATGLPIGLQIVGRRQGEAELMRVASAFQRITDHHVQRPPLD